MQGGTVLSVDNAPLSLGTTEDDEVKFAHCIAARLSEDIRTRYGLMARMFKPRRLELYVLDENCHINDDYLMRAECRESRVHLPHDNATERELVRDIVSECLSNIIQARQLPFSRCAVEICEVEVYAFVDRDRYGMDYALHITLTK